MRSKKSGFTSVQKWTLLSTILASSMVFLDSTALNVALPSLQADLGITGTQLLWIINGYTLFLSSFLLVGGSLGDKYGRNKIFLIGLLVFSISSLIAGLSHNPVQLIVARIFQGTGGALLTPGSLSILSAQFDNQTRGRAIGIWSSFSALTAVLGPVLGGWLSGLGLWRLIFLINLPLAIIVFISTISRIPESKNPDALKMDLWGAVMVTIGLVGISYGFIESPKRGFGDLRIITALVMGGLGIFAFILIQAKSKHPMMPLKLFKSATFSGGNLLTLFVYAAMGGALFFIPLNLIQIQGYSELSAGLSMLPIIILIAGISSFIGKFVDSQGFRLPLIIGPIITSAGYLIFTTYGITSGPSDYWRTFFIAFLLIGTGMGITVAPLTTSVMGSVSSTFSGLASGINNTVARAAGVVSLALMGSMALFIFKDEISMAISTMDISIEAKNELMWESSKLAAASVPESLSAEHRASVEYLIRDSFITAFNRVVFAAAILALIGSLMAFLFIRPVFENSDDPDPPESEIT